MTPYTNLPSKAKMTPTPFTAQIPEEKLKLMLDLIKLSPIGVATYENLDTSRTHGINRPWLAAAKEHWVSKFDWRAAERRINSFPNYTTDVTDDDGCVYNLHFIALFSNNDNAIPLVFYHGWPGSILEFLDMLDLIKKKYTPDQLPYHIVVPSLPGYTFSGGPPTTKDCTDIELARVCQRFMHQLGFAGGYVAQGGDVGSFVAKQSALDDPACKAYHLNASLVDPPENKDELPITDLEKKMFDTRGQAFVTYGDAYGREHATRAGTIGLALSASPIALLAWIGEKFLEWSDEDPPLDKILDCVSLYWLTDTLPRCIYTYRSGYGPNAKEINEVLEKNGPPTKPMGYSYFPCELECTPVSWFGTVHNLVWFNRHERGGHFAAMERPVELFADVEAFVKATWK
ncbi:hypothetical protein ANO11243_084880 [Dothideomycetidae sp. 11243]|nr:hypothetical protein ANO11243_084880 [fungal sp. No.11243]